MPAETQPIHFSFEGGGLGPEDLLVTSFRGREAISDLFRFEIDLASEDHQIDLETMVGQPGKLTLSEWDGDRFVHGLISRFEVTGFGKKFAHYRATLVPAVWPLLHRRRSRIFEEVAVPAILRKVLDGDGIPADQFQIEAKETHPSREYCVQYRESDWAFISRLMEEEGVFYFHQHTEDGAVLLMADRASAHAVIDGDATVLFRDPSGLEPGQSYVWRLRCGRETHSGKVTLRDYDFKRPFLSLEATESAKVETDLEDYDFPGEYLEGSVGSALARIRLQEHRSLALLVAGESNVARFRPGYRFTVDEHHRADLNCEYLITRVEHQGGQEQAAQEEAAEATPTVYSNLFECIPADIPFRPARLTPRPRVDGPQTARVVGPSGEEIHTDAHGRIRVEFPWNRHDGQNDGSSCWMRVSQTWAGPGWGALFIPRIGHEVVVAFLEGDPDKPLVTGSVYNGSNPPPYGLPAEKTKSTIKSDSSPGGGGFNELRFEDAKGSEEIFLHGQKDHNIVIEHDKTQKIGHDETLTVGNDRTKTIGQDQKLKVGRDDTSKVDRDQSITIGRNQTVSVGHDQSESVGNNQSLSVTKNRSLSIDGNQDESVAKNVSISVGDNLTEDVGKNLTLSVGKNFSREIQESEKVQVGKNNEVQVGEDQKVSVTKKYALKAKSVTIQAEDEITLKTGSASIQMKKNGDVTIKGGKITIKGSGDVVIKGSKIAQN